MTTNKQPSRSVALGAAVMFSAMQALQKAGGTLPARKVAEQVQLQLTPNAWAQEIIASNGLPRWKTMLQFYSVDSVKAGFLHKDHGDWTLTPAGTQALALGAESYFRAAQQAYRKWARRQGVTVADAQTESADDAAAAPPEDRFAELTREVDARLAAELLERLRACTPAFLERLVVRLLLAMGYGTSQADAGQVVGGSGDGGIDAVISEDRLGLDSVYVQAKRWQASVGEPELRDFLGALVNRGANKGVFITTGRFTEAARQFVQRSPQHKLALIDGPRLAALMIEHDLGVAVAATYRLKRLDSDFFAED